MLTVPTPRQILHVLRNKPIRKPRQRLSTLPTYTIPEAAQMLAIETRTLLSWYGGQVPILKASAMLGPVHLLSYRDLEEAYRVHLLRTQYQFPMQYLRRAMGNARKMFRTAHPLQRTDGVKELLHDLVYLHKRRGDQPNAAISIGNRPGQEYLPEVVSLFAQRIVSGEFIFPWRYVSTDTESKPVSINPNILSGRLVISGTRIPVTLLAGMRREGHAVDEIARDYRLEPRTVEQALTHFKLHSKTA